VQLLQELLLFSNSAPLFWQQKMQLMDDMVTPNIFPKIKKNNNAIIRYSIFVVVRRGQSIH